MGIKSKPEYRELEFDGNATRHVLLAEGPGGDALLRVLDQAARHGRDADAARGPLDVLYLPSAGADLSARLRSHASGVDTVVAPDRRGLESALRRVLTQAVMGTRLYVAGSETFVWACVNVAREAGVDDDEVQRERCGTLARPVQCVHCKAVDPAVTTNVYVCPGCGLHVFVRDHFSRRLGVYQSVCVDAEAPGEVPAIEEVYP